MAVVARYLFDEAASGTTPTTVADSEASPANLTVTFTAGSQWTSIAAGNGIIGTSNAEDPTAVSGDLDGGKFDTAFHGLKKMAIEFVATITQASGIAVMPLTITTAAFASHMVDLYFNRDGGADARLDIYSNQIAEAAGDLCCRVPNAGTATNPFPTSVCVVRIEIDTAQATLADRCKVFYNGVQQTTTNDGVTQDDTFSVTAGMQVIALGAGGGFGEDGFTGSLYYLSIDNVVPATDNTTALLADNDAEPGGGGPPPYTPPITAITAAIMSRI